MSSSTSLPADSADSAMPSAAEPDSAFTSTLDFQRLVDLLPDGVLIVDRDGAIRFANPAARDLLSLDPELTTRPAFTLPAGTPAQAEISLPRPGQPNLVLEVQIRPFDLEHNGLRLVNLRPHSAARGTLASLRQQENILRSFIQQNPEGLAITDEAGRVLLWSASHERLSGVSAAQASGKPLWEVLSAAQEQPGAAELRANLLELLKDATRPPLRHERRLTGADGTPRRVQAQVFPFRTERGTLLGSVQRDVSEQVLRESDRQAELLELEAQLLAQRQMLHSANRERQRRAQHLAALHKIDQAITATLDLPVVLNVLIEQVTTHLGLDAAGVSLYSPVTQTLDTVARRGFQTGFLRAVRTRLGEGGAGKAALERRIIHISDFFEATHASQQTGMLMLEGFTTYYAVPLIAKGEVKGVLELFNRTPLEPDPEWLEFLEILSGQAAIVIDHAALFEDLQQSNVDLAQAYDHTLKGWARALELRDQETKGHSDRVTNLTMELARGFGFKDQELDHMRRGAILHDIGKMGIPDHILLKPGPLDTHEWEVMRLHPVYAYEMLSTISFLTPALDIPYYHHEHWDGAGYPYGLKGEQIPLPARIFAVADVYDALTHDRPYHRAWSKENALRYIRDQRGKHFYPPVVDLFVDHVATTM